jgi:hypothetical protein
MVHGCCPYQPRRSRAATGTRRPAYRGLTTPNSGVAAYDRTLKSVQCVSCPIDEGPDSAPVDPGLAGASARQEYERRVARVIGAKRPTGSGTTWIASDLAA